MKRLTAVLILACASLFVLPAPAGAHDRVASSRHFAITVHRSSAMPLWLRRHDGFRHWYAHSTLRSNRGLDWWQLYDIYRWELRYHRYRPAYYSQPHRDYDWYRRYWHDHERRHDDRRRRR